MSPLIQAGWTLAVLLALYGFYCHWEARRVELAAAFRRETTPSAGSRYRTRCRWALLGCSLIAGAALVRVLN